MIGRRPRCIGYVRSDVSGVRQQWDEAQIRSCAGRLGYDYLKTVVFNNRTLGPGARLCTVVRRTGTAAVVTPSLEHFDGAQLPEDLVQLADVVTADTSHTYTRSRR